MGEDPQSWEWIGRNYATGWNGTRLLVLGESSYGAEAPPPRFLVENHIQGTGRWRSTYTRFEKLLERCEGNPTEEQRRAFWNRLAFTNFLNRPAALRPRSGRPPTELWAKAMPDFHSLIGRLTPRPDGIIVWGLRLWYSLEREPGCRWGSPSCQSLQWDPVRGRGQIHWPGGPPIPAVAIAHPSSPVALNQKWAGVLPTFLVGLQYSV